MESRESGVCDDDMFIENVTPKSPIWGHFGS